MSLPALIAIGLLFAAIPSVARILLRKWKLSGRRGEAIVGKCLATLPGDEYHVLNNIMLPTVDGTTTQIDHAVVSRYGVFVVETKDYSGWIFADGSQAQWTQVLPSGGRRTTKNRFQNPIRQNYRHMCTMSELTGIPMECLKGVVVFCGDAVFKTDMPEGVVFARDAAKYIRSFRTPLINDKNVPEILPVLREWEQTLSQEKKKSHVENLNVRHDSGKRNAAAAEGRLLCPRCGAKMVLRASKTDGNSFYGCSNYPKCKHKMPFV